MRCMSSCVCGIDACMACVRCHVDQLSLTCCKPEVTTPYLPDFSFFHVRLFTLVARRFALDRSTELRLPLLRPFCLGRLHLSLTVVLDREELVEEELRRRVTRRSAIAWKSANQATYLICGYILDLLVPELFVIDVAVRLRNSTAFPLDDTGRTRSTYSSRLHDTRSSSGHRLLGIPVGKSVQEGYQSVLLDVCRTREG